MNDANVSHGESVDPIDTLAWHFHTHRVAHRSGTHETENGARGGNCNGPEREDYEAASLALKALDNGGPSGEGES